MACVRKATEHIPDLACVAGVLWGGGGGEERGRKHAGEGGKGEETPAVKAYLFSFLRPLTAAKF